MFHPAIAQDYSVTLNGGSVQVQIALNFKQNLTLLDPGFTLPTLTGSFSPDNSTVPALAVASAIRSIIPGGSVENFSIFFKSTPWSNATSTQSFSLVMGFRLAGAATDSGGFFSFNTQWKSFRVDDDILLNGVSINRIGARYFAAAADRVVKAQPASQPGTPGGLTMKLENVLIPLQAAGQVVAAKLVSLDFSDLKSPVSEWKESVDIDQRATIFRLDLGLRNLLYIAQTFTESSTSQVQFPYTLAAELSAEFKANGMAIPNGDQILLDPGTGYVVPLMAVTVAAIVLILIFTYLFEKKLSGSSYQRKKRSR
jgi:hypothetical protein